MFGFLYKTVRWLTQHYLIHKTRCNDENLFTSRAVSSTALWGASPFLKSVPPFKSLNYLVTFSFFYISFKTLYYRIDKIGSKWSIPPLRKKSWGQHCYKYIFISFLFILYYYIILYYIIFIYRCRYIDFILHSTSIKMAQRKVLINRCSNIHTIYSSQVACPRQTPRYVFVFYWQWDKIINLTLCISMGRA